MGALTPGFLIAAVAVAVPLWLHLFHRHETRRIAFPALRYLERTERDHARRIRLRQLLLMLVRVAVLLVVVGAGARLFVRGRGAAHPPTALVIVLDNSMSSGLVVGERRVLDELKELALRSLGAATPDDRIWVIRAGEPWSPSVPTGPDAARRVVETTEVSAAAGDLHAALRRAEELLSTSTLGVREIHLLSDLQASAFFLSEPTPLSVPVVTWRSEGGAVPNLGIAHVLVGGGLPPLEGQRSEVAVRLSDGAEDDSAAVGVRVVLDGRIRGATTVPAGAAALIPLPPVGSGWIRGWVETDPDALRADDRFHFAFRGRRAPVVAVGGDAPVFLEESLNVLHEANRIRMGESAVPDLLVAPLGVGLRSAGTGGSVLVLPPTDATLLPALNRRLADAGIPWRYDVSDVDGEAGLQGGAVPEALQDTRVRRWYRMSLVGTPDAAPRTLARAGGTPWLVEGRASGGARYLLLASPLDPESSTLPVSTAMVRFLDWTASQWAASAGEATSRVAGMPLTAPRAATHLALPSDSVVEIDGSRIHRATSHPGFYTFLADDSVVAVEAVNPAPGESLLEAAPAEVLELALGTDPTLVGDARDWDRAVFRRRQGPEIWRPLLLGALLLLALEATLAASGGSPRSRRSSEIPGRASGTPGATDG